jgi:O-antigen/teichoic acid export membrane protein
VSSATLDAEEIRARVTHGVAAVGLRAMGVRAAGLVANVVLARLLVPSDFGVLAIGQTLVMFGSLITDVGFGAGLMRQGEPPRQDQLDALFGIQLAATCGFALVLIAALLPFGETGHVSAAMTASLILAALAGPRIVLLERDLRYGTIAMADVVSGMTYAVLAILLVVCGLGVWGVVSAHVIRAGLSSAIIWAKTREQRIVPRLALKPLRGLLRFGLGFQAATILDLARSEGLNLLTLLIAGTSVLGIWSLAQRILLIPYLLFEALWRVSYPAIARIAQQGVDPSNDVRRALQLATAVTVCLLVGVSASAPVLVPAAFGPAWTGVASIIPPASLGISLFGPVSAAYGGYLFAMGRAGRVVLATGSAVVVWFVALPILLPSEGPKAFGFVWLLASIAEAGFLLVAVGPATARSCLSSVWVPLVGGGAIAGATLWLSRSVRPSIVNGIALALMATAVYVALMAIARRAVVRDIWRLAKKMIGGRAASGRTAASAEGKRPRPPGTPQPQVRRQERKIPQLLILPSKRQIPPLLIIQAPRWMRAQGGWRAVLLVLIPAVAGASLGLGSLVQYGEPALVIAVSIWLLSKGRSVDYAEFILALWFISPEVRRYVDYRSSFHTESPILVAPYVAAMLGMLFVRRGTTRPNGLLIREFTYLAVGGVAYAAVVALGLGTPKSAIAADLLTWLPPAAFGVFLISGAIDPYDFETMITRAATWLLALFGAYGLFQWIVVPVWDATWLANIGTAGQSFGQPHAFKLRIWGFANSPGTYAGFLAWLLVIVGSRKPTFSRAGRQLRVLALPAGALALGVTGVRAAWIALAVGVLLLMWYGIVRPTRVLAGVAVLVAIIFSIGGPVEAIITQRLNSISHGSGDQSASARLSFQSSALPAALRDPVGAGLGSTGAGVRAAEPQANNAYANTDSGYVEILRTFGSVVGGALILLLIAACAGSVLVGYSSSRESASWAALNAAVPVSLLFGSAWSLTLFIALAAASARRQRSRQTVMPATEPPSMVLHGGLT